MSFLPDISWEVTVRNVSVHSTAYNYVCTVEAENPNNPGYKQLAIGYYLIDFAGNVFEVQEVIDSNLGIIRVYDVYERSNGTGPYLNRTGFIYEAKNGAIILTQAQLRRLDESAADNIQPVEKGIIWDYRGISIKDTTTEDKITRLELDDFLQLDTTTEDAWQGGIAKKLKVSVIDDDTMVTASDTTLATSESIKTYIDNNLTSGSYLDFVIAMQTDNTLDPGASPNDGDRYIILDASNLNANFGTITGLEDNDIVQYNAGSFQVAYDASTALAGVTVTVGTDKNGDADHQWYYNTDLTEWLDRGGIGNHNTLNNLQGGQSGEYYHLTSSQHTDLTDSGDSTLHYHASDRDRTNHTGTQLSSTISDFSESVDDRVSLLLQNDANNRLTWTYNDLANTLTPNINGYLNNASFNTSNGILTLDLQGSFPDITVGLDGRYLTSFTETDPVYTSDKPNIAFTNVAETIIGSWQFNNTTRILDTEFTSNQIKVNGETSDFGTVAIRQRGSTFIDGLSLFKGSGTLNTLYHDASDNFVISKNNNDVFKIASSGTISNNNYSFTVNQSGNATFNTINGGIPYNTINLIAGSNITITENAGVYSINSTGGSLTFTNGLTETSGTVKLGGELTEDTFLSRTSGDNNLDLIIADGPEGITLGCGTYNQSTGSGSGFVIYGQGLQFGTDSIQTEISHTDFKITVNDVCDFNLGSTQDTVFTDNRTGSAQAGLKYASDYSTNFVDRSLVDKGYVDTAISNIGEVTAENGLIKVGDTIRWGGTLDNNTTIVGSNSNARILFGVEGYEATTYFHIEARDLADQTDTAEMIMYNNSITLSSDIGSGPGLKYSQLILNNENAQFGNNYAFIYVDQSSFSIHNLGANFAGLQYNTDYSANYTNRSLVDKEYVDNNTGGSYTFTNGLTNTSGTVKLGGELIDSLSELTRTQSGTQTYRELWTGAAKQIISTAVDYSVKSTTSISPATFSVNVVKDSVSNYLSIGDSAVTMSKGNVGSLTFTNASGMVATDNSSTKRGITYAADYSSDYTSRSLVDKEYVDNAVSGGGEDNYVNDIGFNVSNGILTLGRTGSLPDLTVDLDGRYQQGTLKKTVVDINNWDMQSTSYKVVNTTIPYSNVVGYSIFIKSDSGSSLYNFESSNQVSSVYYANGNAGCTSGSGGVASFSMVRNADGIFNTSFYNNATGLRGYIIIEHT